MKKQQKLFGAKILAYVALSLALIVVGGFIKIPLPVPITLQFAIVLLLSLLLGEFCALSVAIYILMGLVGMPVFANGGGFAYVLQPTFGYLLGFLIGSFLCGKIANPHLHGNKPELKRLIVAVTVFLIVVYSLGSVYGLLVFKLYLKNDASILTLLTLLVFNGLWKDLLLSAVILFLAKKLVPLIGLKK